MRRRDRVTAAERLRNDTLRARRERDLLSARNLDCFTLPAQSEFGVLVHNLLLSLRRLLALVEDYFHFRRLSRR